MPPADVLSALHSIEAKEGRTRTRRWEPRRIDLDLLACDDLVLPDVETHRRWVDLPLSQQLTVAPRALILPHPRIADRAFVLIPLRDVAPDWIHPVSGKSVARMIADLPAGDEAAVRPLT